MNTLCLSEKPSVGLELAHHVLALKGNKYWLVRTEILGLIASADYMLLNYLCSIPYLEKSPHFPDSALSYPR